MRYISVLAFVAGLVLAFQNCSDVNFSSKASNNVPPEAGEAGPILEAQDVEGGHFDLDTATAVYGDSEGRTNAHEHEYDDTHQTNVADFFNLLNPNFDEVDEVIAQDAAFYIRVANADLSPRVALEINGTSYNIAINQHGPFSLSGVAGTTRLDSLRAIIASDAILNSGLVSTQTGCVRRNDFSADGRYRNGALVFQAIPIDQIGAVDAQRGVASVTEALLWEGLVFWHEDGGDCR